MDDGVEFTGRTVDDAISHAESQLGCHRSDLEIDIITQGSRGVFGIGAEAARIRARRPAPQLVEKEIETPIEETEVPAQGPLGSDSDEDEPLENEDGDEDDEEFGESRPEKPHAGRPVRTSAELATEATEVLTQLLRSMGFDAEVSVSNAENPLTLLVTGDNLGVLIGRRGDNLSSLQFMVNLILSKGRRQWPRVVLDVENYRARREESLRSLAERIAYRVRRNGRAFTLEAMPASDRRVIHLSLRDSDDIETYSIGEGPSRRVVVAPKRADRPPSFDDEE